MSARRSSSASGSVLAIAGLPLSPVWFRVFRAFAVAAFVVAALTAVVVLRARHLLPGMPSRPRPHASVPAASSGRIARFVAAVERQMLELVRGNPRPARGAVDRDRCGLPVHGARSLGHPAGGRHADHADGALAVETFSRVASFASAFIPANLGALEASSLAAVAAVGAAGGGAALALARRLRGLFWAGLGLAIYPRGATGRTGGRPPRAATTGPRSCSTFPQIRWRVGPGVGAARRTAARRARAAVRRSGRDTRGLSVGARRRCVPEQHEWRAAAPPRARACGQVTLATTDQEWTDAVRRSRSFRSGHRDRRRERSSRPHCCCRRSR